MVINQSHTKADIAFDKQAFTVDSNCLPPARGYYLVVSGSANNAFVLQAKSSMPSCDNDCNGNGVCINDGQCTCYKVRSHLSHPNFQGFHGLSCEIEDIQTVVATDQFSESGIVSSPTLIKRRIKFTGTLNPTIFRYSVVPGVNFTLYRDQFVSFTSKAHRIFSRIRLHRVVPDGDIFVTRISLTRNITLRLEFEVIIPY